MHAFADAPSRAAPQALRLLLFLLPGALTVYLSFNAGGFFPNTPAFVAALLLVLLALRAVVADDPFDGFSRPLAVAAGALALYALWTLVSAIWSDSPGRALIEFDRALLYLSALVLFGSMARTPGAIRWMVRGLALGIVVVCVVALVTRVLPDVWPIAPNLAENRLSYPLTYWNALGVLCALGIVFCLHLTCSLGEPRPVRVLACGALPALAATLLFTYSRGGILAAVVGVVVYVIAARPRGLLSGVVAAGPATAISLVAAYNADLLAGENPTSSAATSQGHDVALVVAACAAGAIALRALLLLLDARLEQVRLPAHLRGRVLGSMAAAGLVALIAVSVALDLPGRIGDQYDRFVHTGAVGKESDQRTRLTDPGNNGRIQHWDVAVDELDREPLHGTGAGTFELAWAQHRPGPSYVTDAHSLYAEVLGELGLVGAVLLALALGSILVGIALRIRGPNRTAFAAAFAAGIAWLVHAGVDWDWEMPAVTLWLFAVGGVALAAPARRAAARRPPALPARAVTVLACAALAVVPALVLLSQARLDDSLDYFGAENCGAAMSSARSSISALGSRAEPYEVLGYCELGRRSMAQGLEDMKRALKRDPNNWKYHYDVAIALASAGLDPRPAAREALRLNPLEPLTQDAARRFRSGDQRVWRRQGRVLVEEALLQ